MLPEINRIKNIVHEFNTPDMFSRTAECAFYLTLSIFPSLIFIISAIAYIPELGDIRTQEMFFRFVPKEAFIIISAVITSAVKNRSMKFLLISFLFAVWTFSKAVKAIIKGQNMAYRFEETRSFIKLNIFCFTFAFAFFIVIILCIAFLVYGNKIGILLKHISDNNWFINLIYNLVRFITPILMMIWIFYNFFTLGPAEKVDSKTSVIGATITSILWLIFSIFYSFYANHFGSSREIYGSLSTIVILMTWLYLCSMSIVIGYKINAILHNNNIVIKYRDRKKENKIKRVK